MFQLHENTQRRIGLICFAVLCVVPTVLVLAWVASLNSPSYRRSVEHRFSRLLGMNARLAAVRHPKPGLMTLEDLEIRGPESDKLILESGEVRVYSQWNGDIILTASSASVNAAEYEAVEELFERLLARKVQPGEFHVRVSVERLRIHFANGKTLPLVEVRGIIGADPEQSETHWNFQLAEHPAGNPLRLSFRRDRRRYPPTTILGLQTAEQPISCELLGLGLKWMSLFGISEFQGTVQTESHGGRRETQLCGQWRNLDLQTLVRDPNGAAISGLADVTTTYAKFQDGRLIEATGFFQAGPGSAQRAFLEAMALSYDLDWSESVPRAFALAPYSRLAAKFRVENGMLVLRGHSDDAILKDPRGETILRAGARPLSVDAIRFPGLRIPVVEVDSTVSERRGGLHGTK